MGLILENVVYPPLSAAAIEDPRLWRLYTLWKTWRGAAAMPEWRAHPTTALSSWWPSLTLMAVDGGNADPEAITIVVQGENIVMHDRANHMGKTLAQAYTPFLLSRIMPGYAAAVTSGKPVYQQREGSDIKGFPMVFEKLLLPFGPAGGAVTHVLNCLYLQRPAIADAVRPPNLIELPYLVHGLVFDEPSQSQA